MSDNQEVSTQRMTTMDVIMSTSAMGQMNQIAKLMSSSVCSVPKHLQGNVGDCFAIALQAAQWGMNPFAVAQKTHLVNGVLGYEAQLVLSVITSMAPTKGRLKFEWFGDWSKVIGNFKEVQGQKGIYRKLASTLADEKGCGVRVFATLRDEDEPRVLELLLTQAGVRNSTLWADDPKQQLAYLAIKRWSRLYCPDVIMGVYSQDELESIPAEKEINPLPESKADGESEELTRIDKLLLAIKIMSIEDFKTIDPAPFSSDERKSIRKAMTARKEEIIAQKNASVVADIVAEPVDWTKRVKSCGSDVELNALLGEMPDDVQIELGDVIDAQFDLLG